jgi:hypothetical protein
MPLEISAGIDARDTRQARSVGFVFKSLIPKELIMKSRVVGVAGVVVGAIGTLLPKQVVQKLREVAALALQKFRAACQAGQQKEERPAHDAAGEV